MFIIYGKIFVSEKKLALYVGKQNFEQTCQFAQNSTKNYDRVCN